MKKTALIIAPPLLAAALIACIFQPGCTSTGMKVVAFRYNAVFEGTATVNTESPEKIDRAKTYQLYIVLEKPEDCILLSCQKKDTDSMKRTNLHPLFFSLDKSLDLSHFGIKGTGRTYTVIGSNYNSSWTNNPDARVCSSASDPLQKLMPGVYRLRFTSFGDDAYRYTVSAGSNAAKIRIVERPPEDGR